MITREHVKGDAPSVAVYSECEAYRYALTRTWDAGRRRILYIMLNPSKATERQNDPTIERCERRARALGFGALCVTNIFAWRETDPKALKLASDPIGPENDAVLSDLLANWVRPGDMVLPAWGTHAAHQDRGAAMARVLQASGRPLHCLGLTRDGHPRHPLYVSYAQRPKEWVWDDQRVQTSAG